MQSFIRVSVLLMLMFVCSFADVINVPADQLNIQDGIDAAVDGDTVLVADGTYIENINYKGKLITVASHYIMDGDTNHINNTIIDGSQPSHPDSGSVVYFVNGEDTTSVLCGFTITGGTGTRYPSLWGVEWRGGGGVFCHDVPGATIRYNRIIRNHAVSADWGADGGGVEFFAESGVTGYLILEENYICDNRIIG